MSFFGIVVLLLLSMGRKLSNGTPYFIVFFSSTLHSYPSLTVILSVRPSVMLILDWIKEGSQC